MRGATSVPPEQRLSRGIPSRLLSQVSDAIVRLATVKSLCRRLLVWWPEEQPRLIEWADRGFKILR